MFRWNYISWPENTKEYKWLLLNRLAFQKSNIHILYVLWHLSIDFLTSNICQQVGLNFGPHSLLHLQQWQRSDNRLLHIFCSWFPDKRSHGGKIKPYQYLEEMNLQKEKQFTFWLLLCCILLSYLQVIIIFL